MWQKVTFLTLFCDPQRFLFSFFCGMQALVISTCGSHIWAWDPCFRVLRHLLTTPLFKIRHWFGLICLSNFSSDKYLLLFVKKILQIGILHGRSTFFCSQKWFWFHQLFFDVIFFTLSYFFASCSTRVQIVGTKSVTSNNHIKQLQP
jgi:hypothetical protein